ncbi:GNAT family N-acetyltransferase [Nonomuraea sp. NBC_01738]|uniref:GNAT family N-acetyltransferase n=1 Tax=Nonomuraea sp. NBC_01738 TaxID=2976003 RepID=UPI002E10D112|nr:GNAT family N-acetyltransferase [Nonomuraea sp. NBC_01738]
MFIAQKMTARCCVDSVSIMQIAAVRPQELGAPELALWREFQAADPIQDNPFLSPEFTLAVAEFRPSVRVAVISDGGTVVGFFPYQRHATGVARPVGQGFRDRDGAVLAAGCRPDAAALLRACGLAVWQFDHQIPGQLTAASSRAQLFPTPLIDLREGFDSYVQVMRRRSSVTLKGVNYKRRKLGRDVGEVRHEMRSLDAEALRTFMRWKSSQYLRTGKGDLFAHRGIIGMLERLQHTCSERFAGSLSVLYAGERMVAAHFGMYTPRALALWFPSYDPEFGKYSPGFIQLMTLSEDAARLGVEAFELGRGRHAYKDQFKTGEIHVMEGWMARPALGTAIHRVTAAPRQEVVNFVRARPQIRAKVGAMRLTFRSTRARVNNFTGRQR